MRVLMLHNRYLQAGGEDVVAETERRLLEANGIELFAHWTENTVSARTGVGSLMFSRATFDRVRRLCEDIRPDVAHIHNFWMKLSPSVHSACHAAGVATVQTLHNFRLLCANALLLRNGQICEDCVGKVPWRGVVRRCYRNSLPASGAVAAMIEFNRFRGTWDRDVDAYIALTEYSRQKFIDGALPADRIFVKPNFATLGQRTAPPSASDTIVFAGRLSGEKGVGILVSAWAAAGLSRHGRLLILGDGPDRLALERQTERLGLSAQAVVFAGSRTREEVLETIGRARSVVVPSIWYENFPMIVAEAFAWGTPVIAAALGALQEIVRDGYSGLTCRANNPDSLGAALRQVLTDGAQADWLGKNAQREYLARYTPEKNFQQLMSIYRFSIESRGGSIPGCLRCFPAAQIGQ